MGTWRAGPTHPGLYSDPHGHSFSPGPFHTLRGPRSLSSWWAPSGILAHSQLHLDLASFLIESLDVEEPLFIPSLDCVMFYLNVFIIVMFCLPGFLEPESKYIREKSSLTVVSVQIFRPLSHGCFEITFSQLTLHDFWGKERIFLLPFCNCLNSRSIISLGCMRSQHKHGTPLSKHRWSLRPQLRWGPWPTQD